MKKSQIQIGDLIRLSKGFSDSEFVGSLGYVSDISDILSSDGFYKIVLFKLPYNRPEYERRDFLVLRHEFIKLQ